MAVAQLNPQPHPVEAEVTALATCVDLLAETGHPVTVKTLKRWLAKHDVATWRIGGRGALHAYFSDVLRVHRTETHRRLSES
jgi:hypothetical protein